MTTTRTTTPATPVEGTTTSSPEPFGSHGRPGPGAAVAWTEALYTQHRRLVTGLCRALLRDAGEAEDAAQQTFLSAHRALVNGSSPEEPAAWLATIARNECWARIRNRMREPLPTADVDHEASASDPVAEAIRNADLAAMWSAIAELPRQQRDALLLREFGGLSYEELAGALAVSGSAVESLLFRARQGVRMRLKTAYAGVTGASWLDSLARLAGGLGGGMAPVAAKVAAVGVGAAVATGGAVVAPRLLESRHATQTPARQTPARQVSARPALTWQAPAQPAIDVVRTQNASDGHSSAAGEHSSSGEDRSTASEPAREGSSGDSAESSATDGSGQEQASSGGSPESASSSDGSSSDGSSSGGQSGSGDGGVDATTTNQISTVIVPTVDDPPDPGGSSPGNGG